MGKLKTFFNKSMQRIFDWAMGNGLMQEENIVDGDEETAIQLNSLIEELGSEGIVLLKNDNVLPLKENDIISVFGRCQEDLFYVGYGSGGDVHPSYKINLIEGLKNKGIKINETLLNVYHTWREKYPVDHGFWGHWPFYYEEMLLTDEIVKKAREESEIAVLIIGRAAGEDRENKLIEGSYYLTKNEKIMVEKVTKTFKKTIVIMNCGSIIDMSWINDYKIDGLLYAWQLGQESGNAIANVVVGKTNPSGKLSDTIAKNYQDYPSSKYFGNKKYNEYVEDIFVGYRYFNTFAKDLVLFPFGFGLSYTSFDIETIKFLYADNKIIIDVSVKNIGELKGKEVVQIYLKAPKGGLAKAHKVLVAFKKTKLLNPGEQEILSFEIDEYTCSNFDDIGITSYLNSYVLEKGIYSFYIGNSIEEMTSCGSFEIDENKLIQRCNAICGYNFSFQRMTNKGFEKLPINKVDLKTRILQNIPNEIPYTGNQGIKLIDVKNKKNSLEEFVAQLNDKELADLTRGEGGMGSKLGVVGNAGAFGGITNELRKKGIPSIITSDGPAGIRIRRHTSLLPCGTAIACSWNTILIEKLFNRVADELDYHNVDVLLSPGINIHRNPLCGRNFEYYSEDPLLTGKIASAVVKGVQYKNKSACPKHFACNNQETNRNRNDSRLSSRALREIYLKGFEICIREAQPLNIMTSYNKINGVYGHYNYDLVTTVLRNEWGYQGNVITDWWMRKATSPEFPLIKDNAYRVRAQVDVFMPGNMSYIAKDYKFDKKQLISLGKEKGLTRAELQRSAINILKFIIKIMK